MNEAGRQGVGQEKLERANAARELQQSLHKRGGLCNACGFVLRNLDRAKHIQMCQTGLKPILYSHSHTFINTHTHTPESPQLETQDADFLSHLLGHSAFLLPTGQRSTIPFSHWPAG